jgi:hypothetical protein
MTCITILLYGSKLASRGSIAKARFCSIRRIEYRPAWRELPFGSSTGKASAHVIGGSTSGSLRTIPST